MSKKAVFILHEYGAPRHFQALYYLASQGILQIMSGEFDFFKQVARFILRRHNASFHRLIHNVKYMKGLLATKGKTIIVGAAPYHPTISLLLKLKERHSLVYFTSWPFWGDDQPVPYRPLTVQQRRLWYEFLKDISAVAVTKAACNAIARYGANAVHIPHSVDTDLFSPPPSLTRKDRVIVLFVGRLSKDKGVHRLIEVIKSRSWERVEFWFVGKGSYESELVNLSERKPVRYLGFVKDQNQLADIYRRSDIFVLPSIDAFKVENFGIVLLEAMASGLPIITTDAIGPSEIVENGVEGYVIPQDDPQALREALEVLIQNPEKRRRFGIHGRKKAEECYDVRKIAKKWTSVLGL